jgi:hypothetical protein
VRTNGRKLDISYLRWALPVILFLFERGLDVAGCTNLGLSWIIWGVAALVLWWAVYSCTWKSITVCRFMQRKLARLVVAVLIVVFFGGSAWRHWPSEAQPSNRDVIKLVKDEAKQTKDAILAELRRGLLQEKTREEDRLKKEYPLGYVMLAFSGEKKLVLPYAERFDCEWDGLGVSLRTEDVKKSIYIDIPRLKYKPNHVELSRVRIVVSAKPGSRCKTFSLFGFDISAECLKSEPIGVFAVLGFSEHNHGKSEEKPAGQNMSP